jgi:4-amino-4-deoxy-L-arabinose transferase-like glycosyltransferase
MGLAGGFPQYPTPCGESGWEGVVERTERKFEYYPWLVALAVLLSRILTSRGVYFADGPAHVLAAQTHRFVMPAPPGYWLFNRAAGLFANPERAISFMNWGFSAAGVLAFYYAARLLVRESVAKLGCAVYAVIFYAWFSGNVHSTHASQLFFPVFLFLFLALHLKEPRMGYLLAASLAFAVGAGFRPSDGAFMGPMFVYYLARYAPRKQAALAFLLSALLCLGWLLPTVLGYRSSYGMGYVAAYIANIVTIVSPLRNHDTYRSMANIARFLVPLGTALWLLAYPAVRSLQRLRDPRVQLLWLWITPGACFLALIYMSVAPYLNFLTAGLLLLAMTELDLRGGALGRLLLACCIAWNAAFYLQFRPLPGKSLTTDVINIYSGSYTRYAVRNRWQTTLSEARKVSFVSFPPAVRGLPFRLVSRETRGGDHT